MINVLVLCTGNSCRSQIAEGYLRYFAAGKANIYSAGIETHGVNPKAIDTMKEEGIDISQHTSNNVNEFKNIIFDYIITVCDNAKENCPYFPSAAKRFHQDFLDPSKVKGDKELIKQKFRETRDTIKDYCKIFVQENFSLQTF
jgi:arsenate reductase (thioredoxin)